MRTNLIKPKNISEAKSKTSNDGMLDMVIAFDTTGSMASCIRSVKEYVTELVPKLFAVNPNLKLGVVAFGDYCDMESQHEFGKAYQVLDLTYDGHEIIFTVVFKKQDKAKTKKQFESEKEAQRMEAISMIDKAKRQKKSMATAYKEALEFVQSNPIKDYTEGEDRVLRGFKIQFVSRDGKYRCMDMDIEKTEKDTGERLVNINTTSQLIYNGVKYTVE